MSAKITTLLFDLDETLTDRAASIAGYAVRFQQDFASRLGGATAADVEALMLSLDEHGYRPREEVYTAMAHNLPWAAAPEVSQLREHWLNFFPLHTVGRAGMDRTLAKLTERGLRLGIVTNGSVFMQTAKVEQLGLRKYFSTVVISEAVGCKKPDPRIFRHALKELGSEPAQTWFVGDHPENDIRGSAEAGMVPVWFEGIHLWPEEHQAPEHRIRALEELLSLLHP